MSTTNTNALNARDLAALLGKAGFVRGAPSHVREENKRIDRGICRRMKCPACGRRGLEYRPWHCGESYTVLAVCDGCGAAEEL